MHREYGTEQEVLAEISRLHAKLQDANPKMHAVYRYRLRYCHLLLAAMRDGCPERWAEYGPVVDGVQKHRA